MTWLLVLVFLGGNPQAHVYYTFGADKAPECHKLAAAMNGPNKIEGRVAVCVAHTVVQPRRNNCNSN